MKKIFLGLLLISLFIVGWYLFIKKYDYQFHISAKNSPGALYSEIADWKNFSSPLMAEDIVIKKQTPFTNIVQRAAVNSLDYLEMQWEIEPANDSVTNLTVSVRSSQNNLNNRLGILNPFKRSVYLDTIKNKLITFQQQLRNQHKFYNISIENEFTETPETGCVCTASVNIEVSKKAAAMVNTIDQLENYVLDHELQLNGYPFLKITNWNMEQDLIDFDFCFPVTDTTGLNDTYKIKIRQFAAKPALKAIFNGNYRLSHIAWYDLLYQANKKNISTTGLPLEVFHNNPRTEENPVSWVAEIYLPLQ